MLFGLVKGVKAAEDAVTGRLNAALRDSRVLEPDTTFLVEEPEPAFRVCDDAYLALRRIGNPESFLQYSMESRHFLSLADDEKNREIETYVRTKSFTRFLEDVDED
jgi:hypothetical protein